MVTPSHEWYEGEGEFYPPARRPLRVFPPLPPAAAPPYIQWKTRITTYIRWGNFYFGTNYKMYEHRPPARVNSPVALYYTFRNQDAMVVDLSDYVTVFAVVKREQDVYTTYVAEFDGAKSGGKVKCDAVYFNPEGIYNVQFAVVDPTDNHRWGDPAQVRAAKNITDLALDENMKY